MTSFTREGDRSRKAGFLFCLLIPGNECFSLQQLSCLIGAHTLLLLLDINIVFLLLLVASVCAFSVLLFSAQFSFSRKLLGARSFLLLLPDDAIEAPVSIWKGSPVRTDNWIVIIRPRSCYASEYPPPNIVVGSTGIAHRHRRHLISALWRGNYCSHHHHYSLQLHLKAVHIPNLSVTMYLNEREKAGWRSRISFIRSLA